MTHLLFALVLLEMALIVVLLFASPLRTLLMLGLGRMKQGRARLVAGTVATTLVVVFSSAVYNVLSIQKRLAEATMTNPTDQILMADSLLEVSLMGFSLFLGILIDRLHYYLKELYRSRDVIEASKERERYYMEMDGIKSLASDEE